MRDQRSGRRLARALVAVTLIALGATAALRYARPASEVPHAGTTLWALTGLEDPQVGRWLEAHALLEVDALPLRVRFRVCPEAQPCIYDRTYDLAEVGTLELRLGGFRWRHAGPHRVDLIVFGAAPSGTARPAPALALQRRLDVAP